MSTELTENDDKRIAELLTGHRIIAAETGDFDWPGRDRWQDRASGRLTLDDGTQVYVIPNQGGCACSAGDYWLEHLVAVDNVITSVRLAEESDGPDEWGYEGEKKYRIYVVADAVEVNVLSVEGDDGNGYYGTGYELIVVASGETA